MHVNHDGAPRHTNRLIDETSPYLRQHAHNPVEWYAWGEEAFDRAKRENKPIHLSIGYAACHWCHVMAHESFEDPETSATLNELFVNIKVDREERPDVDRIYQIAQQMLTRRSGGWPLTMFLTPDDHRPFFGGTYFPKEPRFGMPGFKDLLQRVATFWHEHESELRAQNDALMGAFADLTPPAASSDTVLDDAPLKACREQLARTFDARHGGFGGAPKFPHAQNIERLLRSWYATSGNATPDLQALYMATLTLRRMGEGGMNDQLGGGFSRYSVDEQWMIPHFEKMLYDNGALLAVYAEAALATGDRFYADIAARTADWVIREMQSPQGGYYSSFDADSEGHEGKFYVWDRQEIQHALSDQEYAAFSARFGLGRPPNFEGHWHLHVFHSFEDIAQSLGTTVPNVETLIESAREKLLAIRSQRVWPGRDEKILTSWNALMIRGMAIASRALGRDDLAESATCALQLIRTTLWRDGRLLATCKDGLAHLNAYLDDYAFLADAIIELQQVRFRNEELEFARELVEVLLAHFADSDSGGFFFTSDDHEKLIHRSKSFGDEATPAGNGVAASVLLRLGHILGEPRYLEAAERTLRAGWPALEKYPQAHVSLVDALEELLSPPALVVLRGPPDELHGWTRELQKLYAPHRLVLAIPTGVSGLAPGLAQKLPAGSEVAGRTETQGAGDSAAISVIAYVCRGTTCSAPITSLAELSAELRLLPEAGAAPEI